MGTETGTAVPRSPVSVAVTLRGHTLVQDKPQASGGADQGPMASELLLAGLLACQHSTFVKVAAKRRLEAKVQRIEGAMEFDAASDVSALRVEFLVAAPAASSDEAIQTALRLTDKACTISRALKVPVQATFRRA